MPNSTERSASAAPTHRLLIVAALALLASLSQSRAALAQQPWSTPDAGGNTHSTNTGNVGIGTASPTSKLNIVGMTTADFTLNHTVLLGDDTATASGVGGLLVFSGRADGTATQYYGPYVRGAKTNGASGNYSFDLAFGVRNNGSPPSEAMRILNNGNLGIGTASPVSKLTVSSVPSSPDTIPALGAPGGKLALLNNGDKYGLLQGVLISGDAFFQAQRVDGTAAAYNVLLQPNGGNVGIGTTNPGGPIDIRDGSGRQIIWNMAGAGHTFVSANGGNAHVSGNLYFNGTSWSRINTAAAGGMWWAGSDGTLGVLQTAPGANPVTTFNWPFFINSTGSVGIGTLTPAAGIKLDVVGNVNVAGDIAATGNIQAKYQDVAEWVEADRPMPAGTVVVLDADHANRVTTTTQSYDTRVAGVVSAKPGIALGEGGDGKVLVATTGRVRVKVDATKAPIKIGDLLVTGEVPGVAIKSVPVEIAGRQFHAPGTIIGKALEPLDKGTGEILVLLSLQ